MCGVRPWTVLVAQIALDTAACAVLLVALTPCVGARPARAAAALYAVSPLFILYCSTLMSDVLFVFLCIVAFYWWIRAMTAPAPGSRTVLAYGWSGAVMGVATLVRPVALYVIAPMVVFILIAHRHEMRRALGFATVYAAVFMLMLCPWYVRNQQQFGRWALSASGDYNLLRLYAAPMEAARRHQDVNTVRAALLKEAGARIATDGKRGQDLDAFERFAYCRLVAVDYIRANPVGFARSTLRGLVHTFANLNTSTYAATLGRTGTPVEIKGRSLGVCLLRAFL